jgi:hypothetical protein
MGRCRYRNGQEDPIRVHASSSKGLGEEEFYVERHTQMGNATLTLSDPGRLR